MLPVQDSWHSGDIVTLRASLCLISVSSSSSKPTPHEMTKKRELHGFSELIIASNKTSE